MLVVLIQVPCLLLVQVLVVDLQLVPSGLGLVRSQWV